MADWSCNKCNHNIKEEFDICCECHRGSKFKEKSISNGDKIRAMSDEELAEFIGNYRPEHIANDWCLNLCPDRKDGDCDCPYGGYETALGWLKSEAKENS